MDSSSLHVAHRFCLYSILCLLNESDLKVHKPLASTVILALLPSLLLLHRVCVKYPQGEGTKSIKVLLKWSSFVGPKMLQL